MNNIIVHITLFAKLPNNYLGGPLIRNSTTQKDSPSKTESISILNQ